MTALENLMADRISEFANVLPTDGQAVPFTAFMDAVRAAGLPPRDWLKAKHKGVILAEITPQGQHVVRRPSAAPSA